MWEDRKMGTHGARLALCLIVMMAALTGCKSSGEEEEPAAPLVREYPGVDERLWRFFQAFEESGAERGVTIDLVAAGITGEIVEIDEENVAGTCNFNGRIPNHVMVDANFFNRVGDLFREFIIFHELGHCFLFRDHLETEDQAGRCTSIMRSGIGECRDNYSFTTRPSYLDELYDPAFRGDIFNN